MHKVFAETVVSQIKSNLAHVVTNAKITEVLTNLLSAG